MIIFVYLCENTIDGIFTAIYDAWESNHGHSNNFIQVRTPDFNRKLFCEYIEVKTNYEKAVKVANSIQSKISMEVYELIFRAAASCDFDKADTIYRSIILGFHMGHKVIQHLANKSISHLFSLNQNVNNELLHYYGFLRFVELKNGLLLGKIRPKNDILLLLSEHFCDRFSDENFAIADIGRNSLIFHTKGEALIYRNIVDFDLELISAEYSEKEQLLQDLFKTFVDCIGIKSKTNANLQQQMLPLRFREFMVEFQN